MSTYGRGGLVALGVAILAVACAACSPPAQTPGFHPTERAPYRFSDSILRLHFDLSRGLVYGSETIVLRPKGTLSALPFHTRDIHYEAVRVADRPAMYSTDSVHDRILVWLLRAAKAGAPLRVDFDYWTRPTRGIYFVHPDRAYPRITPEIWSQGEPTDNRRWFPTWDEPNEKTPSELVLTVPRGWTAVANGFLKSHVRTATSETWDWDAPKPKSTYLIAFAAGPLVRYHSMLGKLNVDSYVQPRYANLNAVCFGRTKDMIAYYQRVTGVPFPFEKYDQITAERFVFGGMEDASATIQTDLALHPATEDVEDSCDLLVSHELAQHWYGDDATMSDWSNLWLNEGFATYYDELWTGERFGKTAFEYARYTAQQTCLAENRQTMQPIVDYVYSDPLALFGAGSHECPAAALHMLRWMLGDARFFRAVHDYLRQYSYRNADTQQFFAAIDRSLGTNLTWFEREWFFRTAYPRYDVSDHYDAARQTLRIRIAQRNNDGKPYRMPIAIEAFFHGRVARIRPLIDRNEQTVVLHNVTTRPDMVLFDPDSNILRQLTFPKSREELAYQLAHAAGVADREWALQQLASNPSATSAVARAVSLDPFWGVRADAVGSAARFGDTAAVRHGLRDPDVRVRIAAAQAAATLLRPGPGVTADLEHMENDVDPNVVAAALGALGALRPPGIFKVLVAELHHNSFRQTIATGALKGLAADCNQRAFALISARTAYGTPEQERDAAVLDLATCARALKRQRAALPALSRLASGDPLIGTRIAATQALASLGDPQAYPVLEHVAESDSQKIVREIARQAAHEIAAIRR
jgi:aminopeptidase N